MGNKQGNSMEELQSAAFDMRFQAKQFSKEAERSTKKQIE